MPEIKVNNKRVHILEMNEGASETIVMIHGMFTNMSVFYFNIAPELAKHFHVVLYDLKSHGMSEYADSGYDIASMTEDLISLLDTLELSKVHLIGYSYGGLIALNAALNHSERVDKLVVIDAPNPDTGDKPDLVQEYGQKYIDYYLNGYTETTNIKPGKRQIEKSRKLFQDLFNNTTIKSDFTLNGGLLDKEKMESINNKTLLLYGKDSDCNDTGRMLGEVIPNSEFCDGEGNHNIPVQNPNWIIQQLNSFFL